MPTGQNGVNGKNAYTFTTASFIMPAVNSNVTVDVRNTGVFTNAWASVGSNVFIQTAGTFRVIALVGTNQLTLENLGYSLNAAPTTIIASGVLVQPSGEIGQQGIAGGAGVDGTSVLYWIGNDDFGDSIATTNSYADFFASYTLPANELSTDGDELEIRTIIRVPSSTPTFPNFKVRVIFGTSPSVFLDIPIIVDFFNATVYELIIRAKRISATQLLLSNEVSTYFVNSPLIFATPAISKLVDFRGSLDFTITNDIKLQVFQSSASVIRFGQFTIYKYKKA